MASTQLAPRDIQRIGLTHLRAGEVMLIGDSVGPPVQRAAGREGLELNVALSVLARGVCSRHCDYSPGYGYMKGREEWLQLVGVSGSTIILGTMRLLTPKAVQSRKEGALAMEGARKIRGARLSVSRRDGYGYLSESGNVRR